MGWLSLGLVVLDVCCCGGSSVVWFASSLLMALCRYRVLSCCCVCDVECSV